MHAAKIFSCFILLIFIITSCKSTRNLSSTDTSSSPQDSVIVSDTETFSMIDSSAFAVPDTVDIAVFDLKPEVISISGVGDMMLGTNFPDTKYLPPDSARSMLDGVKETLRSSDITFGNLEGVILNEGGDAKYCRNPDKCYIFRSPEYIACVIKDAGFDVLSTANNHSGDFGEPGRTNTTRVLDSLNIEHAGFIESPYTIFKKNHLKIGMAAFSPNKGTPQITDIKNATEVVSMLDSLCDIVIVSFHGGAEGKEHMHVTRETETFYGENRGNVYEFSHSVIDAGADIVFGHGPHVPRALEVYKERFISYSLGNFCTYARFNLRGANAYAPIITVNVSTDGKFISGKITSAIQTGLGIPYIDSSNRAALLIQQLTIEDFPESKIFIEDSGVINYIKL